MVILELADGQAGELQLCGHTVGCTLNITAAASGTAKRRGWPDSPGGWYDETTAEEASPTLSCERLSVYTGRTTSGAGARLKSTKSLATPAQGTIVEERQQSA